MVIYAVLFQKSCHSIQSTIFIGAMFVRKMVADGEDVNSTHLKNKGDDKDMAYETCLEKDWKLFRKKVPQWQENYMERLLGEYRAIISQERQPSERFWALYQRMREDSSNPGVQIRMSRSKMRGNLLHLLLCGVIGLSDLEGFSPELREDVEKQLEIESTVEDSDEESVDEEEMFEKFMHQENMYQEDTAQQE